MENELALNLENNIAKEVMLIVHFSRTPSLTFLAKENFF
jgi:hypothetical protein